MCRRVCLSKKEPDGHRGEEKCTQNFSFDISKKDLSENSDSLG
jgi:hypothetical protein